MIKRILATIDLFGLAPRMNFAGREKSQSIFGGLCSILFFAFAIWSTINGSRDLFSKVSPKTISSQSNNENPPGVSISPEGFPIGIQIQTPDLLGFNTYMDESIFTLEVYLHHAQRVMKNGVIERIWTRIDLLLEKCTPEHFGQDLYHVYSKLFELPTYCIAKNQSLTDDVHIAGVWDLPLYQNLAIELSPCSNDTSPVTCSSREKIETFLSGGWINLIYSNMVVNPNNYTHPNGVFQDHYYKILSFSNYYEIQLDLGRVEVTTDSGWLLEEAEAKNYTNVVKITESMLGKPHPQGLLMTISFQTSKLENFYYRRYKKIQDVLAEVAGLTNTAMLILLIMTTPYLKLKFKESLINEIFDIEITSKRKELNTKNQNGPTQSPISEKSPKNPFNQANVSSKNFSFPKRLNKIKRCKSYNDNQETAKAENLVKNYLCDKGRYII